MLTVFLRTLIIYVVLIGAMRIMGKRQIGELEVSDLVTTLLLSEIATLPIENSDIPLSFSIIPIITVLTIEVVSSVISKKYPKVSNILNSNPNMLICRGRLDQKELEKSRISIEELISEIRQAGYSGINEVQYAILETGGKITVIPKVAYRAVTLGDLKISERESGIAHIVIANGIVNEQNLILIEKSEKWLRARLKKQHIDIGDVLLMTVDDDMNETVIKKEGS